MALAQQIADEIMAASERRAGKLADLIALTRDKKDVDVVLRAVELLCKVFQEILPSYRLRENVEESTVKLSKEVKNLREYEETLLTSYKEYLGILERLAKLRPAALA